MAPTTVHDVPDHLLDRVLALLRSHDAVVRAAAVCTRWRRLSSTRWPGDPPEFRHRQNTIKNPLILLHKLKSHVDRGGARSRSTPTMAPTTVHDVPDHLLQRMLLVLRSHDAVVRAAAVCTRWRRLSSTRGLDMCWYRHKFSTCLGHYHAIDDAPFPYPDHPKKHSPTPQRRRVVFVPASPSINPRHFSLAFLPDAPNGRPWDLIDGSGSLLLFSSQRRRGFFPDLVVCEPITRRFVRIHPIPAMKYSRCLGAFLGYRYNVISMSSFRVTCVLHDVADGIAGDVVTAVAYNHRTPPIPVDRRCRNGWEKKRKDSSTRQNLLLQGAESARYAGRTCYASSGSMFWSVDGEEEDGTVLSYLVSSGRFDKFRLPEHVIGGPSSTTMSHGRSTFRFVGSSRGRVRLVSVARDELRVYVNGDRGYYHAVDPSEWVEERRLRLPEATRGLPGHKECYFRGAVARIVTAREGYVVLTPAEETWLFSVDLVSMKVEREHSRNWLPGEVYPYELQTRPKVQACLVS
ncbi:hypothetical protein HU200_057071 [Digitaria exilis]|uniref:F-box domain-containing protein n=1 Tax=Digitaria exilis TaxID=1010633 RepID=A0A835AFN9_9POAL|nr:hypothetical protein HU200_057071 [Digitaria exilis]